MPTTPSTKFEQDDEGRWWIPKDKDATLDYTVSFAKWLAKIGDTLADHDIVLGAGTELTVESHSATSDGEITATISGGTTTDSMQSVTFRITTAAGRIDDRTVYLKIADR